MDPKQRFPEPSGNIPSQKRRRRQAPEDLSLHNQDHHRLLPPPRIIRIPNSPPQELRIKRRSQPQSLPPRQIRARHQRPRASPSSPPDSSLALLLLPVIAYGGEGLYYFVEQFIWLTKSGLIDAKHAKWLQKISAWAELVGYVGSVSLKVRDLRKIEGEIEMSREVGDEEKMKKLKEKKTLKVLSVLQDVADGLMTIADLRDGKGVLSAPSVISSAGLFSAVISTHKNWVSC